MIQERQDGLYLFLVGCAIFVVTCLASGRVGILWMVDFKSVYYGARCLVAHGDPYNAADVLRVFNADAGGGMHDPLEARRLQAETPSVYPPTAFLVAVPFAVLSSGLAQMLWMATSAALLLLSACLVWTIAADLSPRLSGALLGIWLVNTIPLVLIGNPAGIAIPLCVIAVWCFTRNFCETAGVLCLAVSLVLKPQDAWLFWLFFLLSGGIFRRRALQAAAVAVVLGCAAVAWVQQSSPHWIAELHRNLKMVNLPDSINDPGPATMAIPTVGPMIHLQTVFSVFWNSASFYNPATFILCGVLIAVWAAATLRLTSLSVHGRWLLLAAGAFLSLVPVYHRTHDAKLILLAIPACAMLYREKSSWGKAAALLTAVTLLFTGDIPLYLLTELSNTFAAAHHGAFAKLVLAVVFRPAPLLLLASGAFYLWVCLERVAETKGRCSACISDPHPCRSADKPLQPHLSSPNP